MAEIIFIIALIFALVFMQVRIHRLNINQVIAAVGMALVMGLLTQIGKNPNFLSTESLKNSSLVALSIILFWSATANRINFTALSIGSLIMAILSRFVFQPILNIPFLLTLLIGCTSAGLAAIMILGSASGRSINGKFTIPKTKASPFIFLTIGLWAAGLFHNIDLHQFCAAAITIACSLAGAWLGTKPARPYPYVYPKAILAGLIVSGLASSSVMIFMALLGIFTGFLVALATRFLHWLLLDDNDDTIATYSPPAFISILSLALMHRDISVISNSLIIGALSWATMLSLFLILRAFISVKTSKSATSFPRWQPQG